MGLPKSLLQVCLMYPEKSCIIKEKIEKCIFHVPKTSPLIVMITIKSLVVFVHRIGSLGGNEAEVSVHQLCCTDCAAWSEGPCVIRQILFYQKFKIRKKSHLISTVKVRTIL